jgi:hypothetical protein
MVGIDETLRLNVADEWQSVCRDERVRNYAECWANQVDGSKGMAASWGNLPHSG